MAKDFEHTACGNFLFDSLYWTTKQQNISVQLPMCYRSTTKEQITVDVKVLKKYLCNVY